MFISEVSRSQAAMNAVRPLITPLPHAFRVVNICRWELER